MLKHLYTLSQLFMTTVQRYMIQSPFQREGNWIQGGEGTFPRSHNNKRQTWGSTHRCLTPETAKTSHRHSFGQSSTIFYELEQWAFGRVILQGPPSSSLSIISLIVPAWLSKKPILSSPKHPMVLPLGDSLYLLEGGSALKWLLCHLSRSPAVHRHRDRNFPCLDVSIGALSSSELFICKQLTY